MHNTTTLPTLLFPPTAQPVTSSQNGTTEREQTESKKKRGLVCVVGGSRSTAVASPSPSRIFHFYPVYPPTKTPQPKPNPQTRDSDLSTAPGKPNRTKPQPIYIMFSFNFFVSHSLTLRVPSIFPGSWESPLGNRLVTRNLWFPSFNHVRHLIIPRKPRPHNKKTQPLIAHPLERCSILPISNPDQSSHSASAGRRRGKKSQSTSGRTGGA
ncbi:hypothetical protein B0J18DRAFT_429680 [Chaetomium sp. MPI-SDFR-AT-0129]|nr:hypothetical protein B0J18DRAFT_429680 [Chaetomium sp. MPI-SDFR-AT-0129]